MNPPPLPTSAQSAPPPLPDHQGLIVTTGNSIEGRNIRQYLGIVRGIVVQSPGIGRGLSGSFKAFSGGNIPEFSAVCEEARKQAYEIMIQHATQLGAHAVIAFRYDATSFGEGCTEVLAYGTAVTL